MADAAQPRPAAPTFCVEWVRQSKEGYERLTLFADRTLVWKTSRSGEDEVRRQTLPANELTFYCAYFARAEFWDLPEDFRSKVSGDWTAHSQVQLARSDGSRKRIRYDEFSALSHDASQLRSTLEGLKSLFTNPIPPASRFAAERLVPGTLLKRFDGAVFRVIGVHGGHAELEGVSEPYRFFMKVEELRFQFSPPE
jgi:hypothetical protein